MSPELLDALCIVARKHGISVLKTGDLLVQFTPSFAGDLLPEDPDKSVVAGGWKRGPSLDEDQE